MRKVCLLGASGNIGEQSLDIFRSDRGSFELVAVSVGKRVGVLDSILRDFPTVRHVTTLFKEDAERLSASYPGVSFHYGDDGIIDMINECGAELVENAIVGFHGMKPSIASLSAKKILCLANKESLVCAGPIINKMLDDGFGKIYPIDSEHAAIAKCLSKVDRDEVDKLIITGSGGAFRRLAREELQNVTAKDALAHPTWKMGPKITIDCATMMNKGFEVIEAHYLFRWPVDRIEVVLHDESEIHSAIKLKDGTYIADVGKPDMHGPIAYALYEGKAPFEVVRGASLQSFGPYHIRPFDPIRYPAVPLCLDTLDKGGLSLSILNAADEEADYLFLDGKIAFLDIERLCLEALSHIEGKGNPTVEDIEKADAATREYVRRAAK